MANELGAECFAAQAMAIEDRPDSLSVLQRLKIDLLIIGGKQDKVCPEQHQITMHNAIANSRLVILEQCGHFSPIEQPEKVSTLLAQWYLY